MKFEIKSSDIIYIQSESLNMNEKIVFGGPNGLIQNQIEIVHHHPGFVQQWLDGIAQPGSQAEVHLEESLLEKSILLW